MIKLTDKQIESLKSIYPSSEFNTVGTQPWNHKFVWNVKEQFFLDDKHYTVAFDHGYGQIALFQGDELLVAPTSGIILCGDIIVLKHHESDKSWIYIHNNTSDIFPYAEEAENEH